MEFVGEGDGSAQVILELNVGGYVSVRAGELRGAREGCGETADIAWSECPDEEGGRTLEVLIDRPTKCLFEGTLFESKANGKLSAAIGYSLGSRALID